MKDRNNIKTEHQHKNKSNIHTRQSRLINTKLKKRKTKAAEEARQQLASGRSSSGKQRF